MSGSVVAGPITIAVTIIVIGWLSWTLRRASPASLDESSGSIAPDKISAWFTVIVGAAMMLFGIARALFGQANWGSFALAVIGTAIVGFMVPSLTSIHWVSWSQDCIEGPSKMFGPTLGTARTKIAWNDLRRTGTTLTSYWYVEAYDGRRVYWSYLYKGHGALSAFLRSKRPDLVEPGNIG